MRSTSAFLTAFLFIPVIGCTTDGPRSKNWFESLPAFRGPTGSDVVQLEWGLIERPVGDRYLNEDLWALANEQVIALERKDALESNGLRIAQIGGLLPSEFQDLVRSERSNPSPQRRTIRAGIPAVLTIGPVRTNCDWGFPPNSFLAGLVPKPLRNAQFALVVTPSMEGENKVRLSLTPQIEHDEVRTSIIPAADGSGWSRVQKATTDKYSDLNCDVTLAPGEYLLVGCWFESKSTFGKECFVRIDEPRPVQRLLVIRATRLINQGIGSEIAEENVPPRTTAAIAQASLR
jgi:hypothetical protein